MMLHCKNGLELLQVLVDVAHAALIRSNLSPKESRSSFLEVSWQPPPVKLLQRCFASLLKAVSSLLQVAVAFTSRSPVTAGVTGTRSEYKPGVFDDLFLSLFRNKMVKEVGWDSDKPGYDGLIEVANRLMSSGRTNSDTRDTAVRILRSLFPQFLLDLYKLFISPLGGGKVAALMIARVTALTCQWLMGICTVNSVDLPDGTSCESGVIIQFFLLILWKYR
uniref:Uncharacterized protein n=1 Tax=Manihot esculenta TaxID=3983 RepID=A0A2C9U5Y4_MANES